jgi:hypothetical protein
MKKRNTPTKPKNERVKRQRDPLAWRYCLLTLVCGVVLVAGFFYAARQHFSAIDYGIKNAKLRQQKEDLQAEQRRLYLTREISLTPAEIKKAAKRIGLQEYTSTSIETVSRKIESVNPFAEKKSAEKSSPPKTKTPEAGVKPEKREEKSKNEKSVKTEKESKPKEQTSAGDTRPRVAAKK